VPPEDGEYSGLYGAQSNMREVAQGRDDLLVFVVAPPAASGLTAVGASAYPSMRFIGATCTFEALQVESAISTEEVVWPVSVAQARAYQVGVAMWTSPVASCARKADDFSKTKRR